MQIAKTKVNQGDFKQVPAPVSAILIFASTWFVYANSFGFGFTNWDDPVYVVENPYIRDFSWQGIKKIFTVFLSGNYHPFVLLSYWLELNFFGFAPAVFHKTNWFLHSVNSLFVYAILRQYVSGKFSALAGALIFAVHPLHVESVAWVTERKDVLFGFFLLLSTWIYLKSDLRKYDLAYFSALLFFVFSGLSKGQAVILVPILVVLDYARGVKLLDKKYIIRILPFILIALAIGILAIYAQQNQANVRVQSGYGILEQGMTGFYGLFFYLYKTVFPFKLSAFYPYPDLSNGYPLFLVAGAVAGVALLIGGLSLIKFRPLVFAGFLLFFLSIFPVLQFLPVGNAMAADRYYYIPAFGLCLLIGALIDITEKKFSPGKQYPVHIILILFLIPMAWLAKGRTQVWKDSFALWGNVIRNYPEAAIAWNSLANAYYEQNQYSEAIQYFEQALKLDATDPKSFNNLGNCYDRTGQPEKAVPLFLQALKIRPNDAMVYTNLGVAYDKLGKKQEAIESHTRSVELRPTPLGYANLANVLEKAGRFEDSAEYCRKALAMDPNYALAHNNLGVALYRMGRVEEAVLSLQKAARLGYEPAQKYLGENGIRW